MELRIETGRLAIVPFEMEHLEDYCREFNREITKYQYPDPYESLPAAREGLRGFMEQMEREEMLFLSILGPDGGFTGGVEVHGLQEQCPELGIWIKTPEQQKGYAWEALSHVLKFANFYYHKSWFVYEADVRNPASMKLVEKFEYRKEGLDEFQTETGKTLRLQKFLIKAPG